MEKKTQQMENTKLKISLLTHTHRDKIKISY